MAAVGYWAEAHGYKVSEHPLFGGVCVPCHAWGSAHDRGHALDINDDGPHEVSALSWLAKELRKVPGLRVLWECPGHWDHLHVQDEPLPKE